MPTIATTRPVTVDIFLQAVIISDFKELQKSYGKILICCMKLKTEKAVNLSGEKKTTTEDRPSLSFLHTTASPMEEAWFNVKWLKHLPRSRCNLPVEE